MKREDYRCDFNSILNLKLDNLIKNLHITYESIYEFYTLIDKHKQYYIDNDIDINSIYNPLVLKKINVEKDKISKLDILKYNFIKSYNYLISEKVRHLEKQIKLINTFRNIPYELFVHLQDEYNIEVINSLLKGDTYSLGNNLGTIFIKNVNRNFNKRLAVNWDETNKIKNSLIKKGLPLYSINNTSGNKYMVYHTDDGYCFFFWRQSVCKIINKDYYRLTITKNANVKFDINKFKNESDILNNRSLGGFDKLIFLQRLNPNIKHKYKK